MEAKVERADSLQGDGQVEAFMMKGEELALKKGGRLSW